MTLTDAKDAIDRMIAECEDKGIKPYTVELTTLHSASGSVKEVLSARLEQSDTRTDNMLGIPAGNYLVVLTT